VRALVTRRWQRSGPCLGLGRVGAGRVGSNVSFVECTGGSVRGRRGGAANEPLARASASAASGVGSAEEEAGAGDAAAAPPAGKTVNDVKPWLRFLTSTAILAAALVVLGRGLHWSTFRLNTFCGMRRVYDISPVY